MKHIFFIHSHTTFYSALAVIKYKGLNSNEVILFSARKYDNKYFQFNFIDFSEIEKQISPLTLKKIFLLRKVQKNVDDIIFENTENISFEAYIPQIMHPLYQMIITHNNCIRYNYIEEGLMNYIKSNYNEKSSRNIILKTALKIYNVFHNRIEIGHSFLGDYKKRRLNNEKPFYYYLDTFNYLNIENKINLKWEKHKIELSLHNDAGIIILSPSYEYDLASLTEVKKSIRGQIEYLILNKKRCYVKYHPYTGEDIRSYIKELRMLMDIELNDISDYEPMEQVFLNYDNLLIVGLDSSLLFYAKILNKSNIVVSFYKDLCKQDKLYNIKCGIKPIQKLFDQLVISF